MDLKTVLSMAAMGVVTAANFAPAAEPATPANQPPNIVFIMADDLGWRDLGCQGSSYYETPNIDRLAREGMRFTHAYAAAPNCAPSRASLLTGAYTPRHGILTVGQTDRGIAGQMQLRTPANETRLPPGRFASLPAVLGSRGYVTASIGKWHIGADPVDGPVAHGFNINRGGALTGNPKSYFGPFTTKAMPGLDGGPEGEYLTDRETDEAIKFIQANKDSSFFLYLPYYAVHTPFQAKPEVEARFADKAPDGDQKNATYAAMVYSMDEGVGRILRTLDELQLSDNTIVIFTSDNGGHIRATSNAPLRGVKGQLYEGGIRVPLIVRWPGKVTPGRVDKTPVINIDMLPTFAEIAGAQLPADAPIDGVSIASLLTGAAELAERAIYWHFPVYLDTRTTPATAMREGDWKLIHFYEGDQVQLYNLREDPSETNDLAQAQPERAQRMRKQLDAWRQAVKAQEPTPLAPAATP